MPIEVENKLKARARKKGFKGKRFDRYVYGTMNKQGLLAAIHPRLVELAGKIDLGDKPERLGSCSPCDAPRGPYYPTLYVSGRKQPIDIPEKGTATVEYRVRSRSSNKQGDEDQRHSADIEIHSIEAHEPEPIKKQSALFEDVSRLRMLARGDIYKKTLPSYLEHSSLRGGNVQIVQANQLRQAREIKRRIRAYGGNIESAIQKLRKFSCVPAFLIEFADPRPRNSLGEYTSDPGEGVDPNQMAAAYGPPEVSQSHMERIKSFFGKRRAKANTGAVEQAA